MKGYGNKNITEGSSIQVTVNKVTTVQVKQVAANPHIGIAHNLGNYYL